MRNLSNYTNQIRWTDMKDYLCKRKLNLTEKEFVETAKSNSSKQAYIELKIIFKLKINYSYFCKLKRKITRGYTYEKYIEEHTLSLPFKREKYYDIEKDIFVGLQNIILKGEQLRLPFSMDIIKLVKVPRNFNKLVVNWKASNERRKSLLENNIPIAKCIGYDAWQNPIFTEGEKWIIYYTDDYYPMFNIYRTKKSILLGSGMKVKVRTNYNINDYNFVLLTNTKNQMRELIANKTIDVNKLDLLSYNKDGI